MSRNAKGTPWGRSGLEWSYGNTRYERSRRVTVFPSDMLGEILSLSAAARGVLLTLFCRYWPENAPQDPDHIRLEHRMSRARFSDIEDELLAAEVIAFKRDGWIPRGAFGPEQKPDAAAAPRKTRKMPSDWLEKREAVFARDGYACVYCGAGGLELHCDHVTPVAQGGGHDVENLVTACSVCNLSKGAKTVAEWRPDIFARLTE